MKNTASNQIETETRDLVLTNDQLEKMMSVLLNEFNLGLGRDTNATATVKMFPTYVRDVPNGSEEGKFLALDLGGTNFRVLLIELHGDQFKMDNRVFPIAQELMLGTSDQLFDHIAACLADFMGEHGLKGEKLPLGFTFSFPCLQEDLTKARLVSWTKGFKCSGCVGEDVVELLRAALARRHDVDIDVTAVLNDTTGTLMSCAHKNRKCRVGVIVGTGTNACYMERLRNVELWDEDMDDPRQVIINTEWGAFGDNGVLDFLRTEYDEDVDVNSLNPGTQKFEKMISGMYMGEIVRLILAKFAVEGLLFGGKSTEKLLTRNSIDTSFVSKVESDAKGVYNKTREALKMMDIENASDEDCENVRLICSRVSTRAAYLVSAAVATILNKMRRPHTTVGVDGSVYRYHPHFHDLMEQKIAELTHPDYKSDLMLSEDGSGRGAALVAAVAVRTERRRTFSITSMSSISNL